MIDPDLLAELSLAVTAKVGVIKIDDKRQTPVDSASCSGYM